MSDRTPSAGEDAFLCPHCQAYAEQSWQDVKWSRHVDTVRVGKISNCSRCDDFTIWIDGDLYYPDVSLAPAAHPDMPDAVKRDYNEAAAVVEDSPRAAAALLRLAVQRLLEDHLNAEGGSINDYIGYLVDNDKISPRIQRALDAVRITGNNSVHPGRMDMDDNREMAEGLFTLLNEIVDEAIAREKRIDNFYEKLPSDDLEGVENRDGE